MPNKQNYAEAFRAIAAKRAGARREIQKDFRKSRLNNKRGQMSSSVEPGSKVQKKAARKMAHYLSRQERSEDYNKMRDAFRNAKGSGRGIAIGEPSPGGPNKPSLPRPPGRWINPSNNRSPGNKPGAWGQPGRGSNLNRAVKGFNRKPDFHLPTNPGPMPPGGGHVPKPPYHTPPTKPWPIKNPPRYHPPVTPYNKTKTK